MNDSYSRLFIASSELFSGFTVRIQLTEVDSHEDIIRIFKENLGNVLEDNNLTNLVENLKHCRFHIHTNSIEDILTSKPEDIFYLCDHC
jgi:hypothetical protein